MLKFSLYGKKRMEFYRPLNLYMGRALRHQVNHLKNIVMSNDYTSQGDVLDILFANRNKMYGAYLLRRNYPSRLKMAIGLTLGAMLLLSAGMEWRGRKRDLLPDLLPHERAIMHPINLPPDPPKPIRHPVVAPREAAPVKPVVRLAAPLVPSQAVTEIRLVDKPDPAKMVPPNVLAAPAPIGVTTMKGSDPQGAGAAGTGTGGQGTGAGAANGEGTEILDRIELMPSFPGGDAALKRYFEQYLQTPDELQAGTRVKVMVRFVVDKDGSITACVVNQSGGAAFDEEVLRVVRKMPKWRPGIQNGRPVAVYFTLPVTFMRSED